jgi:hypothetical protein
MRVIPDSTTHRPIEFHLALQFEVFPRAGLRGDFLA